VHGLQFWVALPKAHEETAPAFRHYPAESIPEVDGLRVLAGSAYGLTSPVETRSRLLYVEARLPAGGRLEVPSEEERAVYVVEGEVSVGTERATSGRMVVFAPGSKPVVRAEHDSRVVLIGGDRLDGPRYMFWNFISSSRERLEQARADWREGRFPKIPGDDVEFVPLPEQS
jgi:hypothetical protein